MRKRILTAAVAAATLASGAQAAGFYLKEHSVVGLGRAFAGAAAGTDGASSAYFNPAGIVGVEQQIEFGLNYITPDVTVTDNGSTAAQLTPGTPPTPNGNSNVGSRTEIKPYSGKNVPNFSYVHPLSEDTAVSLAIGAPYGFSNDYGADTFNQTDHRKVEFSTVEMTFSYAKKLSPKTTFAISLLKQDLEIEQDKMSPFGVDVKLKAESTDYGYGLALKHEVSDQTTIGASYKSQVTHTGEGTLGTDDITAPFQLPDILALGVAHKTSDSMRVYADATWYGWSAYDEQPITTTAGVVKSTVESNYSNTVSFALGLEKDYDNGLTTRMGVHIDPTPTNDTDRSTSNPDSDRTWLALGASKTMNENLTIDAGFTHIMADNGEINKAVTAGTIRAKTKGSTNIYSLGLRYKF